MQGAQGARPGAAARADRLINRHGKQRDMRLTGGRFRPVCERQRTGATEKQQIRFLTLKRTLKRYF